MIIIQKSPKYICMDCYYQTDNIVCKKCGSKKNMKKLIVVSNHKLNATMTNEDGIMVRDYCEKVGLITPKECWDIYLQ